MIRVHGSRLTFAISAMAVGLLFTQPPLACAGEDSSTGQAKATPVVESVTDTLAFISWTTQNPGGAILHLPTLHSGKDTNHLDLTAESPTTLSLCYCEMVFLNRRPYLEPETTYYYKVSSE